MMKGYLFALLLISVLSYSCRKDVQSTDAQRGISGPNTAGTGSSGNTISETQPAVLTAVNTAINNNCGGYYQAVPARYDSTDISYPLIVFLHGVGELGDGNSQLGNMLKLGLPWLLNQQKLPPNLNQVANVIPLLSSLLSSNKGLPRMTFRQLLLTHVPLSGSMHPESMSQV